MAKQPEFHKYLPLEEWFRNQPTTADQIELTFDQVEANPGNLFAEIGDQVDNVVDKCPTQDPEVIARPGSTMAEGGRM